MAAMLEWLHSQVKLSFSIQSIIIGVDFYNVESISSGGSSPRSLPKMDSLDDIDVTEEEGIDHQSKYLDSTQINLKVPDPIAILKPTLNRSATAVDLR